MLILSIYKRTWHSDTVKRGPDADCGDEDADEGDDDDIGDDGIDNVWQ